MSLEFCSEMRVAWWMNYLNESGRTSAWWGWQFSCIRSTCLWSIRWRWKICGFYWWGDQTCFLFFQRPMAIWAWIRSAQTSLKPGYYRIYFGELQESVFMHFIISDSVIVCQLFITHDANTRNVQRSHSLHQTRHSWISSGKEISQQHRACRPQNTKEGAQKGQLFGRLQSNSWQGAWPRGL